MPYEFASRQALIQQLRSPTPPSKLADLIGKRFPDISSAIEKAVAGSTFRAFRNFPGKPSGVFRTWCDRELALAALRALADRQDFDRFVHERTESLLREWSRASGNDALGYGRASKMINLALKYCLALRDIDAGLRQRLLGWLHVPLDSYTLVGLRNVMPDQTIPLNATMQLIERREQYERFQREIAGIATEAGVPPIFYELLAWDLAHPGM